MVQTKLEKIVAYACGHADPEAAEEIRRETADPESETMQFVRGLARAAANPLRLAGMPPLGSLDCPDADMEVDDHADATSPGSTAQAPQPETCVERGDRRSRLGDDPLP